jgi:hypothetical protein
MTALDRIWTRDVDGTGSQHPCWPDDEGAVAWVRRDPAALAGDELVLAMIGAVYEAIADRTRIDGFLAIEDIAELTPADATAALATRDKRIRDAALEEAISRVRAVQMTTGPLAPEDEYGKGAAWAIESALAALRGAQP